MTCQFHFLLVDFLLKPSVFLLQCELTAPGHCTALILEFLFMIILGTPFTIPLHRIPLFPGFYALLLVYISILMEQLHRQLPKKACISGNLFKPPRLEIIFLQNLGSTAPFSSCFLCCQEVLCHSDSESVCVTYFHFWNLFRIFPLPLLFNNVMMCTLVWVFFRLFCCQSF